MAEEGDYIFDKYDWLWFIGGGLVTLVALYLVKNILEPSHHHHYRDYHHHHDRPIPIAREVEKGIIYDMAPDGKFY